MKSLIIMLVVLCIGLCTRESNAESAAEFLTANFVSADQFLSVADVSCEVKETEQNEEEVRSEKFFVSTDIFDTVETKTETKADLSTAKDFSSVNEAPTVPCPTCNGTGVVKSNLTYHSSQLYAFHPVRGVFGRIANRRANGFRLFRPRTWGGRGGLFRRSC